MQRILNALLQFKNTVLYLFLLLLSLLFIYNQSPFHGFSLEKYGFYFSSKLFSTSKNISAYFNLKDVNKKLTEENEQLKNFELKENDVLLYPEALSQKKRFPFRVVKAHVIKNSFQNQRNFLILDVGEKDGIQPEMGVISANGILGIVHSVSENYANVISILHQDLKVNVRTMSSPAFGSLHWSGQSPTEFRIEDVVSNAKIAIGDTVITGGMSSYFPLGIPLGKITQLEKNEGSGYYAIDLSLFSDPSQVYNAYVIENKDFKELQSLLKKLPQ